MNDPGARIADHQFRWLTAGLVLAALWMLELPDGFSWAAVGRPEVGGDGVNFISKLQWLPLFGLGALLMLARFRLAVALLRHLNPFLIALMLWVLASTLWSYDPSLTLRRAIKVVGVMLICWGVMLACWDYGRYERLLRWGLLAFLLASLLFLLLRPRLGIHQSDESEPLLAGSWRGLTVHKNSFGALASLAAVFWTHALLTTERKAVAAFGLLVCLICLIGARSSTALVCALASVALMLAGLKTRLVQRPGAFLLFFGALFLVPLLWFVILNGLPSVDEALGPLTKLLGRDLSFTGRVPLWDALLDEIPQHPWLGVGYQAFWGPPGTLSDAARAKAGWTSANGHNGYLDTANELGLIGLALLLAAVAFDLHRAARLASLSASVFALHTAVQFYQLVSNLSETMFFRTISLTFLLTVLSSLHLARISLDLDLRRRQGGSLPSTSQPGVSHAHP
ncbi:MAG: O-antigen ligase family protein [Nevskiaceae bacterium]|nr:MAG: O-antigen ligase family protein [Nevskiaceae bacterium]TAM29006.1 MAG: O-antigen ligase family protein [Nevskiaceae bacterium]